MVDLVPYESGPDLLVWQWGGGEVRAQRRAGGWMLSRSWTDAPLVLDAGEPPVVSVGLGAGEVIGHLDAPWLIAPGAQVACWLDWPAELWVRRAGVGVVDRWRPHLRRAVLGPIDVGRVLPAVSVRPVELDEIGGAEAQGRLPLRLVLENHTGEPASVRRFPVAEGELGLFRRGDQNLAGTVTVTLGEGGMAEVHVDPELVLDGVERLPREGGRRRGGFTLAWLLDATRRSTEFHL